MRYIILILTLSGCSLSNDEINKAIEICRNNGGLRYISVGQLPFGVICNNGLSISGISNQKVTK